MTQEERKGELVRALLEGERELVAAIAALPRERLEEGRYEGGWNGRQILAHVAAIEWTYPRLIDLARDGAAGPAPPIQTPGSTQRATKERAADVPTRTAHGGIESYNERQVAKRADASVDELTEEFTQNRAATIAAVEAADSELFGREIRSAGGVTGVLADVLHAVAVLHVRAHVRDIVGAD